ncbi:uncharacterized protein LOC116222510 [Clupea harengus]|uniref:Uncharacterized protein LOC116222510 n=1 Tax=Clupea harengus TaxID=7950 RepID=A0A6P8G8Q8_CLUHA|nr:uncharacterized protein LOC116222510 [Clupea harengus]
MAAPVIICIAIAASGTTLCTVQNVPESHLNHPECEQDWSTVPDNKSIGQYPEKNFMDPGINVTRNSLVTKRPVNLLWSISCSGKYSDKYRASYVVPASPGGSASQTNSNTSVGPTSPGGTTSQSKLTLAAAVGVPLVMLLVVFLVAFLLCRQREQHQRVPNERSTDPEQLRPLDDESESKPGPPLSERGPVLLSDLLERG